MQAWGFRREPGIGDGHDRYLHPSSKIRVQLISLGREGKKLGGSAIGLKKAAEILGLSIQEFLQGPAAPVKPKSPYQTITIGSGSGKPVVIKTETVDTLPKTGWIIQPQEVPVPAPENFKPRGFTASILDAVKVLSGASQRVVSPEEIHNLVKIKHPDLTFNSCRSILSASARSASNDMVQIYPPGQKRNSGFAWRPEAKQAWREAGKPAGVRDLRKKAELLVVEPIAPREVDQETPTLPSLPAPLPVSSNGTADLLSKVTSLDGGQYLYQGDDGALYVVKATKLVIPTG